MGAQRYNLPPPNFPKMEDYQHQNSPKSTDVAGKLHSMAKIKTWKLRNSSLCNIAIFWWDSLTDWYLEFHQKAYFIANSLLVIRALNKEIRNFNYGQLPPPLLSPSLPSLPSLPSPLLICPPHPGRSTTGDASRGFGEEALKLQDWMMTKWQGWQLIGIVWGIKNKQQLASSVITGNCFSSV